jgi:FKBP-type peptidyl-prolyl cis-trans isomerase
VRSIPVAVVVLAWSTAAGAATWPAEPDPAPWSRLPTGVEIQDVVVGTGAEVAVGGKATVHYTGMLVDGTVFDTSLARGEPLTFAVGAHQVIAGWDDGLVGMKVGGKRRLAIPADQAYGSRDMGGIPANSDLYFEVQLVAVTAPRKVPDAVPAVPDDAWRWSGAYVAEGGPDEFRGTPIDYADLAVGTGAKAKPGWRVCADYASWNGGVLVEQTWTRERCTWFRLGDDDLPGPLDAAMPKMRAGGTRVVRAGDQIYEVELTATDR